MREKSDFQALIIILPSGNQPLVFPMGLTDLINRLDIPKKAIYASELKATKLDDYSTVIVPVHWFYSLPHALKLAKKIKEEQSHIRIIAGGYTAAIFHDYLLKTGYFDFIVKGDGEKALPALISALKSHKSPKNIGNISGLDFDNPISLPADNVDFDNGNYRDIHWFPSFSRQAKKFRTMKKPSLIFPWVPVIKGCNHHCFDCFAAKPLQKTLFGREPFIRSAPSVIEDLRYWQGPGLFKHCHFNGDFITMPGFEDYAPKILDRQRYKLNCYFEWYRVPALDQCKMLISAFSSVTMGFIFNDSNNCMNKEHFVQGDQFGPLYSLFCSLNDKKIRSKIDITLYIDEKKALNNPAYSRDIIRLASFPMIRVFRYQTISFTATSILEPKDKKRLYQHFYGMATGEKNSQLAKNFVLAQIYKNCPSFLDPLLKFSSASLLFSLKLNDKRAYIP